MSAEVGLFALILALMIAVGQAIIPQIGAARRDPNLIAFASHAAFAQVIFVTLSFGLLMYAFAVSDYSLLVVASNSNSAMPLHFRLSATWGNHEGSLLLWILILSVFGAAVAATAIMPETLKARVLAIQGLISAAFLALTLFTSSPFERLSPAPSAGMELNPLLQDIGLVLHPPFLYLGYVGVSIVFSFAIGALIEGKVDPTWARLVRPWVLLAWVFLTIGITLGSFWAYYELGWGGWWFWDPVENASFMPWLICTALLHSAIVVEKRQALIVWTILLAILTFSLSLVGTFLVRSGVITSVHAFVTDPARGIWILGILIFFTGGGLLLFSFRSHSLSGQATFRVISRESGLVLNNILLAVATATVFVGTFYPLFVELTSPEKISVGPPYFNRSFIPIMLPLLFAITFGGVLRWKRDDALQVLRRIRFVGVGTGGAILMLVLLFGLRNLGPILALGLAAWVVFGALAILVSRIRLKARDFERSWQLVLSTPSSTWGMIAAHAGLGLLVAGITAVSAWQDEEIVALPLGGTVEVGGYAFTLQSVVLDRGPNYEAQRALVSVSDGTHAAPKVMAAERRYYTVSETVTTEAAISARFLTNLYVSFGGPVGGETWVLRIYYHPFVILIWLGPALMALGGVLSLADKRVRIGVQSPHAGMRSAV